eukprot:4849761-Pyramimonas_sp.AAC.1
MCIRDSICGAWWAWDEGCWAAGRPRGRAQLARGCSRGILGRPTVLVAVRIRELVVTAAARVGTAASV